MTVSGNCPKCGTALLGDAAAGLCPKCLGSLGFGEALPPEAADRLSTLPRRLRLGDYELIAELARGGMGVVYRARQISLNRPVAVKVLLAGQFSNATALKRFHVEAAAAASLNHPNIISIFEVGEEDGQPYFSMELIEGRGLDELTRPGPLPPTDAARLLRTIARAVQFAHERNVLHRDLKPSNIMVDNTGVPHIADFGLAKQIESSADLTLTGHVLGTPGYMPPEQAEPGHGKTTVASDVYSLGAILYHLVTARPPFMADSLTQTLRLVTDGEPVSPRLLNPNVSRDLETICLKCLEKDPARRYATAQELADELDRLLNGEPIRARPIAAAERLARWCRRQPALAGAAVLVLIVAIGSPIALIRINRERQRAEQAQALESASRVRAEQAERQTQQQLYAALLEQARATVLLGEMGHRVRALDALRRAAAISNRAELRREVLSALMRPDLELERSLPWDDSFTLRSLDPGFERIALCRNGGAVEIRSTRDQTLIATLAAATNLPVYNATEWSPDGKYLAVKRDRDNGGSRADWEIWDVTQAQRLLWLRDIVYSTVAFDAQSSRLLAGEPDGQVVIRAVPAMTPVAKVQLATPAQVLRFSPQADRFAAVFPAGTGSRVAVYDATNGQMLCAHDFAAWVSTVAWHPEGKWLAVPEYSSAVYAMNAQTGEARLVGQHKAEAGTAVFSPDGAHLFTGGWEREIICWDARSLRRLFTLSLPAEIIKPSGDGRHYVVMTDRGLRVLAFIPPECFRNFPEDLGERLRQARFSADGRWLAASAARGLGVWNVTTNHPGVTVAEAYSAYPSFASDGTELLASRVIGNDVASFRWHLQAPGISPSPGLEPLPLFQPNGFRFFSRHSNDVAITSSRGSQWLPARQLETPPARWIPTAVGLNQVSPDGRWLAINAPWSAVVQVYRLPELSSVAKLTHLGNVAEFVFSPDGEQLALASSRGVQLWQTRDWRLARTLPDFTGVLFQPDSDLIWLMKGFHTAGLYEADTLELLLPLPNGMHPLALSPEGNQLAISADLRRLQLWDLQGVRQKLRELGMDWAE